MQQAFLSGMHTASLVAAAATLAGSILVAFALPARATATPVVAAAPEPVTV